MRMIRFWSGVNRKKITTNNAMASGSAAGRRDRED